MPNVCRTCRLPRRAYIDRQALTGRSLRGIANELTISYASLRAHVEKHHHLKLPVGTVPGNYLPDLALPEENDDGWDDPRLNRLYELVGAEEGMTAAALKEHHYADFSDEHFEDCRMCDALDRVEAMA